MIGEELQALLAVGVINRGILEREGLGRSDMPFDLGTTHWRLRARDLDHRWTDIDRQDPATGAHPLSERQRHRPRPRRDIQRHRSVSGLMTEAYARGLR